MKLYHMFGAMCQLEAS
ncbi:hypothetical protein CJF32_00003848 [Rutstroemia sp. NJR-2017a WRK4]|nr:hypothetical protein CJF32_00003848 [Rutstroemia sp. NJR-2017a WRK4]